VTEDFLGSRFDMLGIERKPSGSDVLHISPSTVLEARLQGSKFQHNGPAIKPQEPAGLSSEKPA
jgi:hypothetical protein